MVNEKEQPERQEETQILKNMNLRKEQDSESD